jgi:hypothetical protein
MSRLLSEMILNPSHESVSFPNYFNQKISLKDYNQDEKGVSLPMRNLLCKRLGQMN